MHSILLFLYQIIRKKILMGDENESIRLAYEEYVFVARVRRDNQIYQVLIKMLANFDLRRFYHRYILVPVFFESKSNTVDTRCVRPIC